MEVKFETTGDRICMFCKKFKKAKDMVIRRPFCKICKEEKDNCLNCVDCRLSLPIQKFYTFDKCTVCYNKDMKKINREKINNALIKCAGCEKEKPKKDYRRNQIACKECEATNVRYEKRCDQCGELKWSDTFQYNRQVCGDCDRERGRNYRRTTTKAADWVENNRGKMSELQHNHYEKHKIEIRQKEREKLDNDPIFREVKAYRNGLAKFVHGKTNSNKKMQTKRTDYLLWLESLYQNEMTINNYVEIWQIDHVVPLDVYMKKRTKLVNFDEDTDFSCLLCWFNTSPFFGDENRKKNKHIDVEIIMNHMAHLESFLKKNKSIKASLSDHIFAYRKIVQRIIDYHHPRSLKNSEI